jgi:hypothetical protein
MLVSLSAMIWFCVSANAVFSQNWSLEIVLEGLECGGVISGAEGATRRVNGSVFLNAVAKDVAGVVLAIGGSGAGVTFNQDRCTKPCITRNLFGTRPSELEIDPIFFTSFQSDQSVPPLDPLKIPDAGPLNTAGQRNGAGYIFSVALDPQATDAGLGVDFSKIDIGRTKITDFFFNVTIPTEAAGPQPLVISFRDGLQGTGAFAINSVAVNQQTIDQSGGLVLGSACNLTVQPAVGGQIPGDTNQDGMRDVMDVLTLLDHYFTGVPAALPCQGGTIYDAGNLALLDDNGDDEVDIGDGVHALRAIFLSGEPHVLGTACRPIPTCPAVCGG